MQFIRDIYAVKAASRRPVISFEFFPPRTDEGMPPPVRQSQPLAKHVLELVGPPALEGA